MPIFKIIEVNVPKDEQIFFQQLMEYYGYGYRDSREFRITNLSAFFKGEQKSVTEDFTEK